ncbi:MAG: hypothetical protein C4575_10570 [Desulforudis sp.]|nr:MAG: hypothetical protein C4575_10570 [Desulforudis sp.]
MPKAPATMVISHWNTLIEGLAVSPKDFFASVERAIETKLVPDTRRSRVDWKEGGILSAKREYLRVLRKKHAFDICGAPFGNGFFISWWLGELPSVFWQFMLMIPFVGPIMEKWFRPTTYYNVDTAIMFQSLVHSAVLEVVDSLTHTNGLKALSEADRKPKMRDFFNL